MFMNKEKYINWGPRVGELKNADAIFGECKEYVSLLNKNILEYSMFDKLKAVLAKKQGETKGRFIKTEKGMLSVSDFAMSTLFGNSYYCFRKERLESQGSLNNSHDVEMRCWSAILRQYTQDNEDSYEFGKVRDALILALYGDSESFEKLLCEEGSKTIPHFNAIRNGSVFFIKRQQ
ncbi:hypothetical protein FACS1894122_10970 [Alphaproteobacteria bacterium]|nr:hypothetical protein FACS1894122_10970 [Alphaproteobacteria bacterium]